MTTIERLRLTVIEELVCGLINGTTAATRLNLSIRQIKRLKVKFQKYGHDGLIHGSRGKTGVRKIDSNLENNIVKIINENYHDFGPLMSSEKLQELHGIVLSSETIRAIMIRNHIWKSKKKKRSKYFSWRERRSSYGELQQFDGSYHNWFEGRNPHLPEVCLLAAIDDATGLITHAKFDHNESVEASFSFWWEYLIMNGIPSEIYLDKFSTYKINHKAAVDNIELMTQFHRAMKTIGTQLITAHSPQAKGRIERLFSTLQDRLVKEMRLAQINTIEKANIFLKDTFVPWYNRRYAVEPQSENSCHRKLDTATRRRLNSIFAKQYHRGINNDFTIQFKNRWYQLAEIQPTTVRAQETVLIEEWLDHSVHINLRGQYLSYVVLSTRPEKIKTPPTLLTTHRLNWKPSMNHPWRQYRDTQVTSLGG